MMPEYVQDGPPPGRARLATVLIHGRGASARSMLHLTKALALDDVHFAAPQAEGGTWYPHSFLAPLGANESGINTGMASIQVLLEQLEQEGLPARKVALVGFSQGACLALEFAARHSRRYAGVAALSGGLIGNVQLEGREPPEDKAFEYEGSLEGTPVFIGCSDRDAHIPVDRVHESARVLTALGGQVDKRIYRGMGHTINDDEIEAVRAILARTEA